MHWAASHGNKEVVKAFIEAGVNPKQLDASGRSVLEIAKTHNNHEVVAYLKASTKH